MSSESGPALRSLLGAADLAAYRPVVHPCAAVASKLSKSFRRKQRERRVAIRHALKNSLALEQALSEKANINLKQHTALSQERNNIPLDGTTDNTQILSMIGMLDAKLDNVLQYLEAQCGSYCCMLGHFDKVTHWESGSKLNPEAVCFTPSGVESLHENLTSAVSSRGADIQSSSENVRVVVEASLSKDSPKAIDSTTIGSEHRKMFLQLPSVGSWLLHRPYPLNAVVDLHGIEQPIFKQIPGTKLFNVEDEVLVIEGDLCGFRGVVTKPGGEFSVQEGHAISRFESLCAVRLHKDPAKFEARSFPQKQLELYDCESRRRLQRGLDKCLYALEMKLIPDDCRELLVPLLRKGADVVKSGSAERCTKIDTILSSRLDQLAEQILKTK